MRWWFVVSALVLVLACTPGSPPPMYPIVAPGGGAPEDASFDPTTGKLDDRMVAFVFDGGQLEFELYRSGHRIVQVVRNRFAVPIVIAWQVGALENLSAETPTSGVAIVPPAAAPMELGPAVVLGSLVQIDPRQRYRRELTFRARFGDPQSQPTPYHYALPYPTGLTFSVLQGFHGAFSHRGSNEFAVDFDCPVATPVLATRGGTVVAANAAAQGSGTTPEFLDYARTNFVIIQHEDGTLGEYMHLAPSTVEVKPGQRVARNQELALSGNTGFSSTPHLHFQVMTAAPDGVRAQSFPFVMAVAPDRVEEPAVGNRYAAWESRSSR